MYFTEVTALYLNLFSVSYQDVVFLNSCVSNSNYNIFMYLR